MTLTTIEITLVTVHSVGREGRFVSGAALLADDESAAGVAGAAAGVLAGGAEAGSAAGPLVDEVAGFFSVTLGGCAAGGLAGCWAGLVAGVITTGCVAADSVSSGGVSNLAGFTEAIGLPFLGKSRALIQARLSVFGRLALPIFSAPERFERMAISIWYRY